MRALGQSRSSVMKLGFNAKYLNTGVCYTEDHVTRAFTFSLFSKSLSMRYNPYCV